MKKGKAITKSIITEIESRADFHRLLEHNPGLIVIKLGASWCKPCKLIEADVKHFFASSPPEMLCADIDVDNSPDLYAYLKGKRMVNGIPVLLMYLRGNTSFAPDDFVVGADKTALTDFFRRCSL
jgi:thioredoxin-like negative regulator of GroEL